MAIFSRGENTFLFFSIFLFLLSPTGGAHRPEPPPCPGRRPPRGRQAPGGSSAPRIAGPTPERLHPGADATPLALSLTLAPLPALSPPPPAQSAARRPPEPRSRRAHTPAAASCLRPVRRASCARLTLIRRPGYSSALAVAPPPLPTGAHPPPP